MSSMRLEGETAYITGASSGIGAAIARQLAAAGAQVFLGARRMERLVDVKRHIEDAVPGAVVKVGDLDVTDGRNVDAWLESGARLGPCSILVNNAGLASGRSSVSHGDERQWDTMLDVNCRALFSVTRKVVHGLIERSGGDIVMLGSVAGSEPYANGAVYCATKAAVQAFSRALRAELLGKNVRVLCFDPGMVETEFSLVRLGGDADAAKKVYAGMRPLSADDVAECIVFALTRPRHVCVDRMLILSTDQLGTQAVHRA